MKPLILGLHHRAGSLRARERLAALPLETVYDRLRALGLEEAVVLSTCSRFEVCVKGGGGMLEPLTGLLDRLAGESLYGVAYRREGAAAVDHLFSVASGLDSVVVGETDILGQVKDAYASARRAGMTGKLMNVLFQRAAFVGKQVRGRTGISRGHTSTAGVAVELARRIFGDLSRSEVLLLGAGRMAEKAAKGFADAARRLVSNRTLSKAEALAKKVGGAALPWDARMSALETADIVLASTGAEGRILAREDVERAMRRRRGRSLFLIDIAMPRDIEESVHKIDGVYLYTLDDLEAVVRESMAVRREEVSAARALVREAAGRFADWINAEAAGRRAAMRHSDRPRRIRTPGYDPETAAGETAAGRQTAEPAPR